MERESDPALKGTDEIFRPGLDGIVAGETAISTIVEQVSFRGYALEDLASLGSFEETAYLILRGELPTADELNAFRHRLAADAPVPGPVIDMLRPIPSRTPLMDVLRTGASYLAHWDPDAAANTVEANQRKAERMLARLPVVLAAGYRLQQGKEPAHPDKHRTLAGNLLWMLRRAEPSEGMVEALDVSLTVYAEHEYNASTFAARLVTSTMSDYHSAITAAIGALKGPLHGGANARVMDVLNSASQAANARDWVRQAIGEKRRIMGFGHRVYKHGDPRAIFLKPLCAALAEKTGNQRTEELAGAIEQVMREEKGLLPNVDWPSARLYHYLGLPADIFTPLFAVARVAGWSAHILEQAAHNRLIRPSGRYVGPAPRSWKPLSER